MPFQWHILTEETKNEKKYIKSKSIKQQTYYLTPSNEGQGTDKKNETDREKTEITENYSLIDNLDLKLFFEGLTDLFT